jgi:hypothetical protein
MSAINVLTNDALLAILTPWVDEKQCSCNFHRYHGWESVPDSEWPKTQLTHIASLRDQSVHEPTFEEFHPQGTRYESVLAPISVTHFPYNRSDLWQCDSCQRFALRYTEFGGYYVDSRVRWARVELIVR